MSGYDPKNVENGVRDFIIHKAGKVPDRVTVLAEGFEGFVVEVEAEPLPDKVTGLLKAILPPNYRLELKN